MNEILELTKVDFSFVFITVISSLIGIKAVITLLEWVIDN